MRSVLLDIISDGAAAPGVALGGGIIYLNDRITAQINSSDFERTDS